MSLEQLELQTETQRISGKVMPQLEGRRVSMILQKGGCCFSSDFESPLQADQASPWQATIGHGWSAGQKRGKIPGSAAVCGV